MKLKILHQDAHFVAIDKPPGLLVHRSPIDASATVFALQLLRDQIGQTVYPCHRLDRPTSGILLFATDPDALRHAQSAFASLQTEKAYLAVVRGWTDDADSIDYPLKSEEFPGKIQEAFTSYETLKRSELSIPVGRYQTARFSLVQLKPANGRKHQLRRHMAHLRHPIIGDTRHGDGRQNRFLRDLCGEQRLLLHASNLALDLPSGGRLEIVSQPDARFEQIAKRLGL